MCQKLKQLLTAEETQIQVVRDPVFEKPTWNPATAVGKILSSLAHNTDVAALEALGAMTAEERARLDRLREDLLKNPQEAAAQRLNADGVCKLIIALDGYAAAYSDEALQKIKALAKAARAKRAAANAAARQAFDELYVAGVGAEAWRALWEAARRYAEHTAYPDRPLPHDGDELCVLCHQPLTEDTKTRLQGFEAFIKADAEAMAEAAETAFQAALKSFASRKIDMRLLAQARCQVALQHPAVARAVLRLAASADLRRRRCLNSLTHEAPLTPADFAPCVALPSGGSLSDQVLTQTNKVQPSGGYDFGWPSTAKSSLLTGDASRRNMSSRKLPVRS